MKAETKLLIGVGVLTFLVALVSIYAFVQRKSGERLLDAEADAEIIKVEPKYSVEYDGITISQKIHSFTTVYRYEIDGKTFEKSEEFAVKAFKVGDDAKICYNSRNHDEVKLFSNAHVCGE